ncbi:hypothetical protein JYU34_004768 [Plutella xylostella]|uniref:Uncharacterized protein n=1 Tax=Plutella xylostella TaxID=51655 RepID=A0ABQ7QYY7_PLUXY|nr:hypothetical protein JYU34_004768 [Plutella xylostella]
MGFISGGETSSPPSPYNTRRLCIFSVVGLALAITSITMALMDPIVILSRYNTRLANGSKIHRVLQQRLDSVHVQTFLFNVTNADRFLSGEDHKLKVEEVGPFTYKETRTNLDLELDEAAGVMRYSPHTDVSFLPEESVADPREVNITMPNIALLTMASMLSSYGGFTKIPFNMLVRRIKTQPIVSIDAHNYLWGYDEPLITFGNSVLPGFINFKRMGIMDRLYDPSLKYRLEVGATDADKFQIRSLNGAKGMKALNYDDPERRTKCNTFEDAYEGIAYPPGMTPDSKVRIWRNVLCRFLELDFVEERHMEYGAQALVYTISNRTYNYGPDKECLCNKGVCVNGISDLSPCFLGLPLAISNAHFLDGEPKLFRRIEGLNPDPKKHGSHFLIEPTVGMALGTSFTIQVNVVVDDVAFSPEAGAFSNMVVPIAYYKIVQPPLHEAQLDNLRKICITGPRIFLGVEIALFLIGITIIGYSMRRILWNAAICGDQRAMEFPLSPAEKLQASGVPLMK